MGVEDGGKRAAGRDISTTSRPTPATPRLHVQGTVNTLCARPPRSRGHACLLPSLWYWLQRVGTAGQVIAHCAVRECESSWPAVQEVSMSTPLLASPRLASTPGPMRGPTPSSTRRDVGADGETRRGEARRGGQQSEISKRTASIASPTPFTGSHIPRVKETHTHTKKNIKERYICGASQPNHQGLKEEKIQGRLALLIQVGDIHNSCMTFCHTSHTS